LLDRLHDERSVRSVHPPDMEPDLETWVAGRSIGVVPAVIVGTLRVVVAIRGLTKSKH